MIWLTIGLILGAITWTVGKKKVQYFRPITHHGGILGISPFCNHCTYQIINRLGIRTGSRFPLYNYYHISCWFKQLLPRDRK